MQHSVSLCTEQARTQQVHRRPMRPNLAIYISCWRVRYCWYSGAPPLVAVGRVSGCISLLDGHTGQPRGDISPASSSGEADEADRCACVAS